ncbi:hypothetical protein CN514_09670 [Bacillus sp. AFS001701]|nr:hypothetical protein CN514_09670 [Bacillus sp. AFS001701]
MNSNETLKCSQELDNLLNLHIFLTHIYYIL